MSTYTLPSRLRLKSRKDIERLFKSGEARSFTLYPLRVIYAHRREERPSQVLVSVSKRRFKHAVHRNRVKRLLREAYRLNRHLLPEVTAEHPKGMQIAFVYLCDRLPSQQEISDKVCEALRKIARKAEQVNPI